MKRECRKCGVNKLEQEFTSNVISTKRGYVWCSSCNKQYNRDKHLEYAERRRTNLTTDAPIPVEIVEEVKALPVSKKENKITDKKNWDKVNQYARELFPIIICRYKPSDSLFEIASDCLFVAEMLINNNESWIDQEE